MKCTVLLLFVLMYQAYAGNVSSQNARVNINRDQLRGLTIPGYYSLKASVNPATTSTSYTSKQVKRYAHEE